MLCRLGSSLMGTKPSSLKMVVDFRNGRDSLSTPHSSSASGHHRHPGLKVGVEQQPSPKKHNWKCTSCGSWGSSTCQRLWWCTSTPPWLSPSSPPPSPSGMLQPLPRTRADCSVSFADRLWSVIPPGPVLLQEPEACRKDCGQPRTQSFCERLQSIRTKDSNHTLPSAAGLINNTDSHTPSTLWTLN